MRTDRRHAARPIPRRAPRRARPATPGVRQLGRSLVAEPGRRPLADALELRGERLPRLPSSGLGRHDFCARCGQRRSRRRERARRRPCLRRALRCASAARYRTSARRYCRSASESMRSRYWRRSAAGPRASSTSDGRNATASHAPAASAIRSGSWSSTAIRLRLPAACHVAATDWPPALLDVRFDVEAAATEARDLLIGRAPDASGRAPGNRPPRADWSCPGRWPRTARPHRAEAHSRGRPGFGTHARPAGTTALFDVNLAKRGRTHHAKHIDGEGPDNDGSTGVTQSRDLERKRH